MAAAFFVAQHRSARIAAVFLVSASLVGCATGQTGGTGEKETIGTVAGALLGGIGGSFIGNGQVRVISTIAGAAIGGLIGNRIGAMLDAEDQKALQEQAAHALLTQPDNAQVNWASSRTDAVATVMPENSRVETREVRVVRDAAVAPAPQLDLIGAKYTTKEATVVRLAPSEDAGTATTLAAGSAIWAVGTVHGQPWIMVAKKGKSIGYVPVGKVRAAPRPAVQTASAKAVPSKAEPATAAQPAVAAASAQPATPAQATPAQTAPGAQADTAFDLDATAPVRNVADLDALAPTEKADVVVGSVMCRDIKTTATAQGETETSTQTACRSPDGAWELN